MKNKTLIIITGPTGVGKTEATLRIAEHFNVPVINADSRQIFSEIPIGTAAPTAKQQQRVQHYFVGNHHLEDYYSASLYEQDVLNIINSQHTPISLLSGGSMMYIDAVCNGIDDIPTILPEIREEMMRRLETEGLEQMCNLLRELDPEHWKIVDRNNPRRVIHALEICIQTGKTYTSFRSNTIKERPFNVIKVGLNRDRDELYNRINQRVLAMIEEGMIEEALQVYPMRTLNSLNTVGYKELFEYLDGLTTLDEAIFKIQSNTRRYARKQLTWYKKDTAFQWFNPDNIEEILNYVHTMISNTSK
ncbi:tRNA (adenosine(37)-N6)-dimethylallyltransferase MiaA [Prevotella melaninogenica]|uniref:tRNA (adenosine(37)-N6)-dimethylallyltransferase MiaA n=1 Tax=Prevotella melaninogenica TaxID=28132 RepID=UPI001C5E95CE|nr:tRNA (adenosine(37)-N6)-dimethylallyltransferase MiaA [Prevotella melaninogenica]MBW4729426.1 tRNA (adenosine(37)-N6)-dimethylallyltransferase MiaA [Prevotella melaninogenica]MBW4732120.1 tRNA (adenosine(37)-N6)-dimethylallyltransferase MiaA [Prevotella melaninogenica]MBW4750052.1 tRNA (adenosine(37)-N6)-dimethylallyltransferase MiaA [Prevotella melaninogenica]